MTAHTDKSGWENMKASARRQWHKLSDHDLRVIDGDKGKLVARLEELYGDARDVLSEQVEAFFVREHRTADEGAQRVADSKQKNLDKAHDVAAGAAKVATRTLTTGKPGAKPRGTPTPLGDSPEKPAPKGIGHG